MLQLQSRVGAKVRARVNALCSPSSATNLLFGGRLSADDCFVLECIGKSIPFEIAVGQNGFFWVHSTEPSHTIGVANVILQSELLSDAQVDLLVQQCLR